jgi:hypothetical protein
MQYSAPRTGLRRRQLFDQQGLSEKFKLLKFVVSNAMLQRRPLTTRFANPLTYWP